MLYDALGRLIEGGQKTENTDTANNFNKIFGDTIMGFYNPNIISSAKLLSWIKDNTGPRTEVTHNYYDVQNILPQKVLKQQEIIDRLATSTYSDTIRADSMVFNNSVSYSYSVRGAINTIIDDDSISLVAGQRYKRIDYEYDLISQNINQVDYQRGNIDQYHHVYSYDADNRIVNAKTSKDSVMWDNDVTYFYYAHGPLSREEIGDQQVQGIDYAHTLNGEMKGVNSDQLDGTHDMGHDALQQVGNLNRYFARDAVGYTLTYFDKSSQYFGDYDPINTSSWNNIADRFEAYTYGSDLTNSRRNLFNGNPSSISTTITKPQVYSQTNNSQIALTLPQGTAYNYDQLNRLVEMKAYQNLDAVNNIWQTSGTYNGLYHNWFSYDANGNILTQKRADSVGEVFDSLTYQYNVQGGRTLQNRLYHVNDAVNISGIHYDIKDEGTFLHSSEHDIITRNNYRYDAISELSKDSTGGLDTLVWTNYGELSKVKKHNGDSIIFVYDGSGNRLSKEYKPLIGNPTNTYYVYDGRNNIIAVYVKETIGSSLSYSLKERHIYANGRIGTENTPIQLIGSTPLSSIDTISRYLGEKHYEIDNHLGDIMVVVTDRKIPRPDNTNTTIDHYEADVLSSNDYYPYGMYEPGRNFNSSSYRFGFNKKEKIDEIYGSGNNYDFGRRMFDSRLGRFLTLDDKFKNFPWLSPYAYAANSPMKYTDRDGQGPGDRIKAARFFIGIKYKQELGQEKRAGSDAEGLKYLDCAEMVCRVLYADGITSKIELYTAHEKEGLGPILSNTKLFVKDPDDKPQEGDIALWEGHVGIVSHVGKDGKFTLIHAPRPGKYTNENGSDISASQYVGAGETFIGFYHPKAESADGKVLDVTGSHQNTTQKNSSTDQSIVLQESELNKIATDAQNQIDDYTKQIDKAKTALATEKDPKKKAQLTQTINDAKEQINAYNGLKNAVNKYVNAEKTAQATTGGK
jgi:RHS repeat-associated protein